MRLEVSTQLWFIRAPSRLCLMECHSTLSTEGCTRQRKRRREGKGAAAGSQYRSSWINAERCKVSSQAQPTASSTPHVIYPKVTTQKLKIKSNTSCSEELSQLMESMPIKMETTGRASNVLGSRSTVITTTGFCPFKFGFDICDYTRPFIGFSLHFQICINLIFFSFRILGKGSLQCHFLVFHSEKFVLRFQHYQVISLSMNPGVDCSEVTEVSMSPPYSTRFSSSLLSSHQLSSPTGRMAQHKQKWLGKRSKQKESKEEALSPCWPKQHLLLYSPKRLSRACPKNGQKTAFAVTDSQHFSD